MITNLQLLRGLAALAVVIYHTGYQFNGISTDFLGVCVFFAISGFIMTYVSRESADGFLMKRLVRIVPLYWICTIAFLLWCNLGCANPVYTFPLFAKWGVENPRQLAVWVAQNYGLGDWSAQVALIKSVLFIPYENAVGDMHPVLGVGWTLNLEMYFYALFAAALWVSKKYAPVLVIAVVLLVSRAASTWGAHGTLLSFYGHPYVLYFCAGIVCYYLWRLLEQHAATWSPRPLQVAACVIAFTFVALNLQLLRLPTADQTIAVATMLTIVMSVVLLALLLNSAGAKCSSRPLILLGDASYSLYLTHSFIIVTLQAIGNTWPVADTTRLVFGMPLAVAASIALALAVHLYVEKPMTAQIRRRLERGRAGSAGRVLRA